MSKNVKDIYRLWPSIGAMAEQLNEAPSELLRCRSDGRLPDPRHDTAILARAMDVGVYLRRRHLDAIRQKFAARRTEAERREAIGAFYDAFGGSKALSIRTGISFAALRVAKTRARLPARWKMELCQEAAAIGFDLDRELFDPVV